MSEIQISMQEKCFLCGDKHAQCLSDLMTHFVYMECPTCGKYILHYTSRYIGNRASNANIKDNLKASDFLVYHKSEKSEYFIGTQEEFEDFILTFPHSQACWVTKQQIENWYPRNLSDILNMAILYFNEKQEYFGQTIKYSYFQLRSIYLIDADGIKLEDKIDASYKEQVDYITHCLFELGLIKSVGSAYVPPCKWGNTVNILLTPKGIDEANKLRKGQNRDGFVAMSFHESANDIRKAIKHGIDDAEYSSLLMDEVVHNHQIVPEMLRLIKESRFMIMDITQPNFGAYYEAGYAQGLGKEVIITCSKEIWDKKDFSCEWISECLCEMCSIVFLYRSMTFFKYFEPSYVNSAQGYINDHLQKSLSYSALTCSKLVANAIEALESDPTENGTVGRPRNCYIAAKLFNAVGYDAMGMSAICLFEDLSRAETVKEFFDMWLEKCRSDDEMYFVQTIRETVGI